MKSIIKDVLSGPDGKASFGRCGATGVLVMAMVSFGFVVRHVLGLSDPNVLGVWLTNIPTILLSVAAVVSCLYGIGKAGEALPEVMKAIRQAKDGQ